MQTALRGDGWFGRTDGYVKVTAGGTTRETHTIPNNNDPYWRQTLSFASQFRMTYLSLQVPPSPNSQPRCCKFYTPSSN
ncbi:unnamed protein product [Arctogadus glacialis]